MTIRDYLEAEKLYGPLEQSASSSHREEWTAEFMDLIYIQRIKEAFDEDGSGYVTVQEVNKFTEMQPKMLGWRSVSSVSAFVIATQYVSSLRHWLSYWTIGKLDQKCRSASADVW